MSERRSGGGGEAPPGQTVLHTAATASCPALFLRPWEERDVEPLIEVHRDPVLRRWTRVPVTNPTEAAHWLRTQAWGWTTGDRFSFAMFESGDRLVGNVVVKRPDPTGPTAEVGYWTARAVRGRGVAPRGLEAVTSWAFGALGSGGGNTGTRSDSGTGSDSDSGGGLDRLELLHQVDNPASCRVAEKCGYRLAAILPPFPPYPLDGHLHIRRDPR